MSLQANDDEEEKVDRDVKRMGMWRRKIRGRGPKVLEINCKLSHGEKPFLRMTLFDICVYHRMNTNGYISTACIFHIQQNYIFIIYETQQAKTVYFHASANLEIWDIYIYIYIYIYILSTARTKYCMYVYIYIYIYIYMCVFVCTLRCISIN